MLSMFMPKPESSLYWAKYCWNTRQWAVPASKSSQRKCAVDNWYLCKSQYAQPHGLLRTIHCEGIMIRGVSPVSLDVGPYRIIFAGATCQEFFVNSSWSDGRSYLEKSGFLFLWFFFLIFHSLYYVHQCLLTVVCLLFSLPSSTCTGKTIAKQRPKRSDLTVSITLREKKAKDLNRRHQHGKLLVILVRVTVPL